MICHQDRSLCNLLDFFEGNAQVIVPLWPSFAGCEDRECLECLDILGGEILIGFHLVAKIKEKLHYLQKQWISLYHFLHSDPQHLSTSEALETYHHTF